MARPLDEMLRQLSARTPADVRVMRMQRPARRSLGPAGGPAAAPSETYLAEHGEIGIALEKDEFEALLKSGATEKTFA